jgi:hypothetical protein
LLESWPRLQKIDRRGSGRKLREPSPMMPIRNRSPRSQVGKKRSLRTQARPMHLVQPLNPIHVKRFEGPVSPWLELFVWDSAW